MKRNNNPSGFGLLALAGLVASMICSYLWGTVGTQALAVGALAGGGVFALAIAKCILAVEQREGA